MIDYTCPGCGAKMQSPASMAGMPETCPDCGTGIPVPVLWPADPFRQAPGAIDPDTLKALGTIIGYHAEGLARQGLRINKAAIRSAVEADVGRIAGFERAWKAILPLLRELDAIAEEVHRSNQQAARESRVADAHVPEALADPESGTTAPEPQSAAELQPLKKFDLNIEKVLEDWETYHAVREAIANAMDEQLLTRSKNIEIFQDKQNSWHIRDFGRGLKYEHLTQKENEEKLQHTNLIGKFGVGLKDALATFDRRGVKVLIKSKFGDITLDKSEKHDFEDIVTLHACISEPSEPNLSGTDFILQGCLPADIDKAKALFLRFSGERVLENTQFGEVLSKNSTASRIYINGVRVAEEENFLFSYNITSLTAAIKKALNRERTNVGRTAYSDRVKSILLSCKQETVARSLVDDLRNFEAGTLHDELKWTDVSVHATKILNSVSNVVFMTPSELVQASNYVDQAKKAGYQIVTIPENVRDKISGQIDLSGNPIQDLSQFKQTWNESFEFKFVSPNKLTPSERAVYDATPRILALIGGLPGNVKAIKISETMRTETYSFVEAAGLWDPPSIIIKRTQLRSLEVYAGTLLHEIGHARSGAPDISSEFEQSLTSLLGKTGSHIDDVHLKNGIISKIFG